MMDILDSVIRSSLMSTYVFQKVRFDNAKDTKELIAAADEASETLVKAVEYKLQGRVESLVEERLQNELNKSDDGKLLIRVGSSFYTLTRGTEDV